MKRIGKFLALRSADQGLFIQSAVLLLMMRVGLRVIPFQTFRDLLAKLAKTTATQKPSAAYLKKVVWAINLATRYVGGTCLARALATQVLMSRRGHPASLRIGVLRSDAGILKAHAWLESNGTIIVGGTEADLALYQPMPALDRVER